MTAQTLPRWLIPRLPFFYGWVIVAICFLTVFLTGTTSYWGLTVFIGPMHDDTGWSNGSILTALAVRSLVAASIGLLSGHFADRRQGPRLLLFFGLIIDCTSMSLLRLTQSPLGFILLYGVVGGVGSTGTRLLMNTLVPKWFVSRRGRALSITQTGGSISALIMVPVVAFLIDALGWREAWTVLAALQAVILLPCVVLMVRAPEDIGLLPDNGRDPVPGRFARATAATERSFTLHEAIHTWRLWFLLLAMFVGTYSLSAHTLVMVPWYKEVGFSSGIAASAMISYGIFSIISRFLWGHVSERYTTRHAIVFQTLLTAVAALTLLQVSDSRVSLYVIAGMQGLTLSGFPILQSLVWPEFFGRRHIGSIVGTAQFFVAFANAGAQVASGIMYDHTGTYATPTLVAVGTWIGCALLMMALRPAREPAIVSVPLGESG